MMIMTAILEPDTPLLDELVAVVVVNGEVVAVVAGAVVATVVAGATVVTGAVVATVVTAVVAATVVTAVVAGTVVTVLCAVADPADRATITMARDNAAAVFLMFA